MPPTPIRCTLLDDDDPAINYLNRRLLLRLGVTAQVCEASNGQETLHLLATCCTDPVALACPDMIFLDVNMPVLNGFDFLAAYQQLPLARQRAIVMITTSLYPADVARADALPVAGFLTKLLTADKVAQEVQEHFGSAAPAR